MAVDEVDGGDREPGDQDFDDSEDGSENGDGADELEDDDSEQEEGDEDGPIDEEEFGPEEERLTRWIAKSDGETASRYAWNLVCNCSEVDPLVLSSRVLRHPLISALRKFADVRKSCEVSASGSAIQEVEEAVSESGQMGPPGATVIHDEAGTICFEHLPANSFLALVPKSIKVFNNVIEISLWAHKVFEELLLEKEALAKAVSSLQLFAEHKALIIFF
ncbi:hypothetical protein B0H11DRAFT_1930572 [Mycena galericulata]|nr:hypothetical protein B0H11DRAFT_1930572 [Mycena galericulata]